MKEPTPINDLPDIYEEVLIKLAGKMRLDMSNFIEENHATSIDMLINSIGLAFSDILGSIYFNSECNREESEEDIQRFSSVFVKNSIASFENFKENGHSLLPPLK